MCKNSKLSLSCTFVAIFRKVSGSAVRLSGVSSQGSGCRLDGLASGSPCGGGDGQQVSRWRPRRAYIIYKGGDGLARGSRGSVVRVSALDALHGLASGSQGVALWLALLSMVSRWRRGGDGLAALGLWLSTLSTASPCASLRASGSARRRQKCRNSLSVRHIPKNGCQRHPFAGC